MLAYPLVRTGAVLPLFLAIFCGCESTGLSVRETGMQNVSNYMMALGDSAPTTMPLHAARPKLPIRLAVAQVGEVAPLTSFMEPLKKQDKLIAQLDAIPSAPGQFYPTYNRTYYGPQMSNPREEAARSQVDALCRTAEQLGDEYLFLFGGNIDHTTVRNGLGVLNLTVVGGFFVPSREMSGEGRATGALVELQSRRIVAIASAQAQEKSVGAAFTDEKTRLAMLKSIRDKLTADLAADLLARLERDSASGETR